MKLSLPLLRLRSVHLRPSVARIGILQVIDDAAPGGVSAEQVYRAITERGTHTSLGTVYRTLSQCHAAGLLLREYDEGRTAYYRLRPARSEAHMRLRCRHSGRTAVLADPELHARLLAAAADAGWDLAGLELTVEVEGAFPHQLEVSEPVNEPAPRRRLRLAAHGA